jgi:uncharacterized repeat protein (TIGR01451 family)
MQYLKSISAQVHNQPHKTSLVVRKKISISLLLSGAVMIVIGCLGLATAAQAAPGRRDWCGVIWSVENTSQLAWINSSNGVTNTLNGPNAQIPTLPQGGIGSSVAAIGIHKESGTMYAFDRGQAANATFGLAYKPGVLYKYRFGVNTTWQAVAAPGLIGLGDAQTIPSASNNLNKMSVDGNTLFIAESNGIAVYSIPLDINGNITGAATPTTYSFVGDPVGTPPHRSSTNSDPTGTEILNGGDLTTDEYGEVYNITYNSFISYSGTTQILTTTKAYFYRQDPVAKTWIYQGQTPATASFAGAAFYRGNLYVKSGTQLKRVNLTHQATGGYTGWNNALINVGSPSSTSSADLASCGTPVLAINKSRQLYKDAALTNLAASQTKVRTGEYIKYTITAQNVGDAWARSAVILDSLPAGTIYVPNSAQLNGTNLNLATYPGSFAINSAAISTGIVRYTPDPDTATITFAVKATATTGSISNQATTTYVDIDNLPSGPVNCTSTPKIDCGNDGPPLNLAANLVTVKRITAINGDSTQNPNDNTPLNQIVLNSAPSHDTHPNWPSNYLVGAINAGKIKPGDEVEYTIYFMNASGATASGVRLCDRIVGSQTFLNNGYGTGKDIEYKLGTNPLHHLTRGLNTTVDRAQLDSNIGTITGCPAPTITGVNNGTVVIDIDGSGSSNQDTLTNLPAATVSGTPNSYGYFRFKTKINP